MREPKKARPCPFSGMAKCIRCKTMAAKERCSSSACRRCCTDKSCEAHAAAREKEQDEARIFDLLDKKNRAPKKEVLSHHEDTLRVVGDTATLFCVADLFMAIKREKALKQEKKRDAVQVRRGRTGVRLQDPGPTRGLEEIPPRDVPLHTCNSNSNTGVEQQLQSAQ
jgi:hypothetical protein